MKTIDDLGKLLFLNRPCVLTIDVGGRVDDQVVVTLWHAGRMVDQGRGPTAESAMSDCATLIGTELEKYGLVPITRAEAEAPTEPVQRACIEGCPCTGFTSSSSGMPCTVCGHSYAAHPSSSPAAELGVQDALGAILAKWPRCPACGRHRYDPHYPAADPKYGFCECAGEAERRAELDALNEEPDAAG